MNEESSPTTRRRPTWLPLRLNPLVEDSGFDAEDLDAVIVSTVTSDVRFPATACFVQNKLGAWNAVAFDLCGACSGFVYALSTAHAFIASGKMEKIMVIGVEILSKFVDWEDRSTCVLFGDGAGAAVIEACGRDEGIMSTYMKSNGSLTDLLYIPAGGSRMPFDAKKQEKKDHCIKMKGDGVFKYAVRAMADAITKVLGNAGASLQDVDLFIPHQANIRIIDAIAEKLSIPSEKVVVNLDRLGNTSSASIPIAYDEAVRDGRLKRGDLVLFVSFGGGLTWGSVLLRYS